MPRTPEQAFRLFLDRLTPTQAERSKAASHRQAIYAKLDDRFGLHRMFESGSFRHGTGVAHYSDVDYFASLKSDRPNLSSSSLVAVRTALQERFPNTNIRVARPAVVIEFAGGSDQVEVIPAYANVKVAQFMRFTIPGVTTEWLQSTPEAHLAYVSSSNEKPEHGAAKSLARLAKGWKYFRRVPISSFYLEMRASSYMSAENYVSWPYDVHRFLAFLLSQRLAAMNDPTGATGRIEACSSESTREEALSKLNTAVSRALRAKDNYVSGRIREAFDDWNLLFAGQFPSYWG